MYLTHVVLQKTKEEGAEGDSDDDAAGGIFRLKKKKDSRSLGTMHERDCSLEVSSISVRDWSQPEVLESIRDCFVTGKWRDSEDAETRLRDDDECMYMGFAPVLFFKWGGAPSSYIFSCKYSMLQLVQTQNGQITTRISISWNA